MQCEVITAAASLPIDAATAMLVPKPLDATPRGLEAAN